MDAIVVCAFFVVLPLASLRWGYDSRVKLHSTEEQFAAWGFSWTDRGAAWDSVWWQRAWDLSDVEEARQRVLFEARAGGGHVRTSGRRGSFMAWWPALLRRARTAIRGT